MIKRIFFPAICLMLIIQSCEKTGPANIPAYVYVPEFIVDTNDQDLKIYSENITDVWVYLDNDNQGAYELPAKFPLAETGNHQIELRPGIQNGGISSQKKPYPYYTLTTVTKNFQAGKTDTFVPIIKYDNDVRNITVAWEEGFETLGSNYEVNPNSDTSLQIIEKMNDPENVFLGNRSGGIFLDENAFFFELASPNLTSLPRNNIPIYLEINYKTNESFIVGMYRDNKSEQFPIYIVKEKDDWNKIYLDFSEYVQASVPGSDFNIYIGIARNSTSPNIEMYLDNIKLIHY